MKKQFIANGSMLAFVCLVYIANFYFKQRSISMDYPFIRNHLNDLLAPISILAYSGILLNILKINSISSPAITLCICALCGIVWEYFSPLLNPQSVTDYIDCYNANCEFDDTQHEFVHLHDYCLG